MKYRFLILIFLFIFSVFIIEKNKVLSQEIDFRSLIDFNTGLPAGMEEQISVEQIPRIPAPNEPVSIRLTSYLTNLNKARITWTQDGEVLNSGIGIVSQVVMAPSAGEPSVVQIRIEKEQGGTITKTINLNPAQVDLIYEAFTYTPPFYKGKSLFTSESSVEIIAVPHFINTQGQRIPASGLVYTWNINGVVQQNISGYGQDVISLQGSLIERPLVITVDVSAPNSTLLASNTIRLTSTNPDFVLYENNPVFGVIYEQAIQGKFLLERPSVDFEGVPYFFSALFRDDYNLNFTWLINGVQPTNKASNENYIILRNDNNIDGKAIIDTRVRHGSFLLQQASNRLELDFKKIDNQMRDEIFNF